MWPGKKPPQTSKNRDKGIGVSASTHFPARASRRRLRPSAPSATTAVHTHISSLRRPHRLADGDFEVRAHEEDALGCCKAFGADPGQARLVERGTQFLRVRDKALQQESAICVVEPARYPRDRSSRQVWARCSDGGGCRAASLPCSEGALLTDVFENHCDSVAVLRFEYRTQVLNAVVDDELEADDCTCHGQRYVIDAANLGGVLKQQMFESSCTPSTRARIIARRESERVRLRPVTEYGVGAAPPC